MSARINLVRSEVDDEDDVDDDDDMMNRQVTFDVELM